MPVASAQVKSCVLLAGLGAEGRTEVVEPNTQTRDHTERMLRWFGVEVKTAELHGEEGGRVVVSVEGGSRLEARDLTVPGDISSAAFPLAAAALLPGSELELEGVGLNPTRAGVLDALRGLGCELSAEDERETSNEPTGLIRVRGDEGLKPRTPGANVIHGAAVAQLIDELPVLAVVGTCVEGGIEIRDARELRVKESDRIASTVANLRAMGADVEEYDDGLRVEGPVRLRGARLQSYGDHRIAMAFAVAALAAEGETLIEGAEECVAISFPEFFPLLESLTER
jgi:3-phosphoshikimate 1-carboxyvinyltransferase